MTVKKRYLQEWAKIVREAIEENETAFSTDTKLAKIASKIEALTAAAPSLCSEEKAEAYNTAFEKLERKLQRAFTEKAGYERANTILLANSLSQQDQAALIALARQEDGTVISMEEARARLRPQEKEVNAGEPAAALG